MKFHTDLNITSCQAGRGCLPNFNGCQDPKFMKKANVWVTEIAFKMGVFILFKRRQGLKELVNYVLPQSLLNFKYRILIIYFRINRI